MGGDVEEDDVGGAGEEVVHDPLGGQLAVPVAVDGHDDGGRRLVRQRRRRRRRGPVLVRAQRASLHRATARPEMIATSRRAPPHQPIEVDAGEVLADQCDGCGRIGGAGEEGREVEGDGLCPPLLLPFLPLSPSPPTFVCVLHRPSPMPPLHLEAKCHGPWRQEQGQPHTILAHLFSLSFPHLQILLEKRNILTWH